MAVEPLPTPWTFPSPAEADEYGVVGVGADLEPGTLLHAYRHGIFPMPIRNGGPIAWWSPDPRGVLELDRLRVSRSLRQACRRYRVTVDTAFDEVVLACADPGRPHGWIDRQIRDAYGRLHRMGWAHSVEVWDDEGLAGGLYGVAVGGLFAGESMFHRRRDASKVALVALVDRLDDGADRLIDVQWLTDHLASLGAEELPRHLYLARLDEVLGSPEPSGLGHGPVADASACLNSGTMDRWDRR
ncbi:MAG: leucyl/phenylalanyl-tRNA--protein transferase [Acidimicrobiales bacterium]|nr:leucyl/phenylalanyl-tRNA--protein transferase [Acidimicrobiales bacterium]